MSIHTYHGGAYRPQSGGRLISRALGPPTPFLPRPQVGYGIGGVLKPLARTLFTAAKGQAKKIPAYLGKLVKRHGKKAAQQVITGVLAGKFKKGKRKKAVKRIIASNVQKAKKDIQKAVIKSISQPKRKMTAKKKTSHKRKRFFF